MGGAILPILAVGASLYGAKQQRSAISDARKAQAAASSAAQRRFQPYSDTGEMANQMIQEGLSTGQLGGNFTSPDLANDPGYQFRLAEGQRGVEALQSSRGNLYSGQAAKEIERYRQGLAAQETQDAYNRWLQQQQNRYGMLSGQSGQGMNAAGGIGNIDLMEGESAAQAALARQQASAQGLGGALGGINNLVGSASQLFSY